MFINYKKLAEQLNYGDFKKEVVNKVAEIIADKIVQNEEVVENIMKKLYIYEENYSPFGYTNRRDVPIEEYIVKKVADRLVPEVFNLQKAEVLKNVHAEGILNILHSKLEDQAKQHVLDFITKPVNNNGY